MKRTRKEQRAIRRAIGPAATTALLDVESRTQEIDRFLLTWQHGGFFKRLLSLFTGKF